MKTAQEIVKDLIGLKAEDQDEIISVFESNKTVILSSLNEMNYYDGKDGFHLAYEDSKDSFQVKFEVKNGIIIDAWEV